MFPQPIPMIVNDEETQQKRKTYEPPIDKTVKRTKKELKEIKVKPLDAELKIELTKENEIRRYKDEIYIVQKNKQNKKNYKIVWRGESEILLPGGSKLKFNKVKGKGISLEKIKNKKLIISNRKGGEFFKPDLKRPTKKIKQLLQGSDLPPWEREKLPLLFLGKDLVCVPTFGVHHTYQGKRSEIGLEITWFNSN